MRSAGHPAEAFLLVADVSLVPAPGHPGDGHLFSWPPKKGELKTDRSVSDVERKGLSARSFTIGQPLSSGWPITSDR